MNIELYLESNLLKSLNKFINFSRYEADHASGLAYYNKIRQLYFIVFLAIIPVFLLITMPIYIRLLLATFTIFFHICHSLIRTKFCSMNIVIRTSEESHQLEASIINKVGLLVFWFGIVPIALIILFYISNHL